MKPTVLLPGRGVLLIVSGAVMLGYLIIVSSLCAVVVILHDGTTTVHIVDSLVTLSVSSLGIAAVILTGHNLAAVFNARQVAQGAILPGDAAPVDASTP